METLKQSESQEQDFIGKNIEKIEIQGRNIKIGENQSVYQDVFSTYLLGKESTQGDVGVFKEINRAGFDVSSENFLSCVEVEGSFDVNDRFYIHALDPVNLSKHLKGILVLSGEERFPEKISITVDKDRADLDEYKNTLKRLFKEGDVEIIFKERS
jgi:hypothetical protein